MSWIPDIPRTLVAMGCIESSRAPMRYSTKLFWSFCTEMMPPDEFYRRMAWWKDYDQRDTREDKGWLDKDIQDVMNRGYGDPDEAAQVVLDRLDALTEAKRVPYLPDEPDDAIGLYVEAHLEATRLVRLLRAEGYSERSRETLGSALRALTRFQACVGLEQHMDSDRSVEYGCCMDLLRSFLCFTRFRVQKQDGEYEAALSSLSYGIGHFTVPPFKVYLSDEEDADQLLNDFGFKTELVPWLQDLHFEVVPEIRTGC